MIRCLRQSRLYRYELQLENDVEVDESGTGNSSLEHYPFEVIVSCCWLLVSVCKRHRATRLCDDTFFHVNKISRHSVRGREKVQGTLGFDVEGRLQSVGGFW